jgi:antirestriction protein ArdC
LAKALAHRDASQSRQQEGISRDQHFPSRLPGIWLAVLVDLSPSTSAGRIRQERRARLQGRVHEYRKENSETREAEKHKSILLRHYALFNLEQCEGIKYPDPARVINPIEQCESFVRSMPNPPGFVQDSQACYRPSIDTVGMPAQSAFHSAEEYYSTLFHELTHSTGHPSRIARAGIMNHNPFGSEDYSKEELVAEMGAAMLCGAAGIESQTLGNSAAYLQSWINKLKSDSRLIVSAASQAQKAADYILARATTESDTKGENEAEAL